MNLNDYLIPDFDLTGNLTTEDTLYGLLSDDEEITGYLGLIEDIAFISGAIMDNDEYSEGGCAHDCAHCAGCSSLEYGELVASADFEEDDEEDDDEYEFEEDDEDND